MSEEELRALVAELELQRNMAFTRCTELARAFANKQVEVDELTKKLAALEAKAAD